MVQQSPAHAEIPQSAQERTAAMEELLTAEQVAADLRVGVGTVRRWCKDGTLPGVKIGKEYRFRRSDLNRWYERQRRIP